MDGLLIDTEAVYIEAMQDAAGTLGLDLPLDLLPLDGRRAGARVQSA